MKNLSNNTIATLGPVGTDAHHLASKISSNVKLFKSFEDSMSYAINQNTLALVACGYIGKNKLKHQETWIDLNFRYYNKLKITKIYLRNTKKICIAKNINSNNVKKIALHPSTREIALNYWLNSNIFLTFFTNKPQAVKETSLGNFDACIGSIDIINKYSNLVILQTYKMQMVWALYKKIAN